MLHTLLLPLALAQDPPAQPSSPLGLPLSAFSVEAGWAALTGKGYGALGRVHVPHASLDLGGGVRIVRPDLQPVGGASVSGYWRREGAGLTGSLGLSTLAPERVEVDGVARIRYRLSPWVGVGFRTFLVEQDSWALPLTLGGGYHHYGLLRSGADSNGWFLHVSLGVQVPIDL